MNKREIIASLNKIANELDKSGLYKETDTVTIVMIKVAENDINFDDEENEREDCCPNCGNCDERLGPDLIVMGRFSNGVVAWCENNNCSYDYWQDAKEGTKDPICPLCNKSELFFEYPEDPYHKMHCTNTECNAEFENGLEVKQ